MRALGNAVKRATERPGKWSTRERGGTVFAIWATILVLTFLPAQASTVEECDVEDEDNLLLCETRMMDAQGDLLIALEYFVDQVEISQVVVLEDLTLKTGVAGEATDVVGHLEWLKKEHGRAKEELSEATEDDLKEMIQQAGKQRGKDCELKEVPDVANSPLDYLPPGLIDPTDELGDGECNKFEAWDEEKLKLVKVNERSQPNICDRICLDDDIPDDPNDYYSATKKKMKWEKLRDRHLNRKSESIDATEQLTEKINNATYQIAAASAMADSYRRNNELVKAVLSDSASSQESEQPSPLTECLASDKTVQQVAWVVKIGAEAVLLGAKAVSLIAETAYEIQDQACKQDVAGFNTSVGCIPALIVKQIADGVAAVFEAVIAGADLAIDYDEFYGVDADFECLNKIRQAQMDLYNWVWEIKVTGEGLNTAVGELDSAVGDLDQALQALTTFVLENREYIKNTRTIVLTPHGRRDNLELYEAPVPPTEP